MPTRSRSTAPRILACGLLGTLLLTALPALAKRAPDRTASPAAKATSLAVREVETAGPVRSEAGAALQYGRDSGLLRHYYLRQPGAIRGAAASPQETARRFLAENAAALGLDAARLDTDLQLRSEKQTPSGTHFVYQHVVNGVAVFRSDIVVKVSARGEVSSMHSTLRPGIDVGTTPVLDADAAVRAGVRAVGPAGKALGDFGAELQIVEFDGGPRLAWIVSVPVEEPLGDWRVFVDALSGDVLALEDRMVYVNGTGRVFDPDPRTRTGNPNLVDSNDADSAVPFPASYDTRTLLDITLAGSTYSLNGPFARVIDFESPAIAPVTSTDPAGFQFQRNPDAFEDVMVYFHLDQNQRYIQSLGFTNINNRVQEVDSHGLNGADNSHYIPSTKRVAFGDGGVDDAEDADVIIHEYGHSIQDNINPNWGGGQQSAMGEGFGDYWSGSYSLALYPNFQPRFVFNWDGHNAFWPGRVLVDSTLHYPQNCCSNIYVGGTLWCSGLIDCWRRIGRTVMDRLVLDHHFALGSSSTMEDAANQIIQSDIDLYGGAHVQTLVTVFGYWGFVDPAEYVPAVAHTPLGDTENTAGPFVVTATVTSLLPLDASALWVIWGTGAPTDSLLLSPTGNPNEYAASIPGPLDNVDVRYYITVRNSGGGTATSPAGAPANVHVFHVGADGIPPVIAHTPIADYPLASWPALVQATITDNLGVNPSSAAVSWTLNSVPQAGFGLVRAGSTDTFTGTFPSVAVHVGDTVRYHITAADVAAVPNTGRSPAAGEHAFRFIDVAGRVLVLDDDELSKTPFVTRRVPVAGSETEFREETMAAPAPDEVGLSASSIASILSTAGYQVTSQPAATSNPATWSGYDLLVSASGANLAPVSNAAYRSALEAYVAAGGKLLVEGGDVAFVACFVPGYPTFAANVLHTNDWDGDSGGALTLLPGQASHPIATTPYTIPATLPVAFSSYGSQDHFKPLAPAFVVYGVTAQPANAGILVYDDNTAPESAQIVFFGFNFKAVSDLATRTYLLLNTVGYLLAPEVAPDGAIAGTALLANQLDHSGILVTASPGGATATTSADGSYTLPNLYPGTYVLTATKPGYQVGLRSGIVVVAATTTSQQDFRLYPQPAVETCLSPGTSIPDNNVNGISSVVNVAETWAVQDVEVDLNITHTAIGDLVVELRHGARTVRLHNRTGGTADNLVGTYPTTLPVSGPGALGDFTGDPANGAWTLFVSDNAGTNTGTLVSWCLRLRGPVDTTVDTDPESVVPQVATLGRSEPNPVGPGGTTVHFALPQGARASLVLYDVAGHRVRTLVDAALPAGWHAASWDGRDGQGTRVAAGVYFCRLVAGEATVTRKLVVVR